jgi:hypothetical protein
MSGLGDIHPSDRALLERLAFMLMDVARGDLVTRGPLVPLTEALMSRQRDGDDCSADEVGAVVDQLLAIADDWYGVRALAEAATAVITGAPLPAPRVWADGYRRLPEAVLAQ